MSEEGSVGCGPHPGFAPASARVRGEDRCLSEGMMGRGNRRSGISDKVDMRGPLSRGERTG